MYRLKTANKIVYGKSEYKKGDEIEDKEYDKLPEKVKVNFVKLSPSKEKENGSNEG